MEKRFEKDERLKHIENEEERKKEEERLKVWSLFKFFQFPFSSGSLTNNYAGRSQARNFRVPRLLKKIIDLYKGKSMTLNLDS